MLLARPARNAAAQVEREASGEVALVVGRKLPRWHVPPLSWVVPMKPTRTLRLDPLGAQVWDMCDGERTVEAIVDAFAAEHGLSFHEARVAVTEYIGRLVRRGALAVALSEDAE